MAQESRNLSFEAMCAGPLESLPPGRTRARDRGCLGFGPGSFFTAKSGLNFLPASQVLSR